MPGCMSSWGAGTDKPFLTFWLIKKWKRGKTSSSKYNGSDLSLCCSKVMYYTTWIMGVKRMQVGCNTDGIRPFVIWIHPFYCNKGNFGMYLLKHSENSVSWGISSENLGIGERWRTHADGMPGHGITCICLKYSTWHQKQHCKGSKNDLLSWMKFANTQFQTYP